MSSAEVKSLLCRLTKRKVLVLGMGNIWRGDDGAGIFLANLLQQRYNKKDWSYLQVGEHPESYMGEIADMRPEVILLCDAARFAGREGELRVLDPGDNDLLRISTHTYDISIFLNYLSKRLPCEIHVIGIQGVNFDLCDSQMALSTHLRRELTSFVDELCYNHIPNP